MSFKSKYTLTQRIKESFNVLNKYPSKIPIICEKSKNTSVDYPILDKNKYLVENEFTVGQFIYVIRKRMKLPPEKALFLFVNGMIPSGGCLLLNLYEAYRENDNFLYLTYTFENTFG